MADDTNSKPVELRFGAKGTKETANDLKALAAQFRELGVAIKMTAQDNLRHMESESAKRRRLNAEDAAAVKAKARDEAALGKALERERNRQLSYQFSVLRERVKAEQRAARDTANAWVKSVEQQAAAARKLQNAQNKAAWGNIGTAVADAVKAQQRQMADHAAAWQSVRGKITGAAGAITASIFNLRNAIVVTFASGLTKKIVDFGAEFQQGLAEINTILDKSPISIAKFESGLLEMSTRVPQKLSDLTKATYQAISSGVDPADALAFVEKSAKSATAGLATAFEAVDLFTSILNAYGMQVTEVGMVSDKIFRTIVRGKTTFQELARELGAVAPVANAAGLSFDELLASIATLTISGVRTNEAVTAIRNAIQKIVAPPKVAEKAIAGLNKVLAESGKEMLTMSAQQLRERGLVDLLDKLYQATNGDIKIMRKLFEEITGLNAVLLLSGEGFENLKDILADINNSAGATDVAFGKMIVSFKNQMQLFKNEVGYVFARVFLDNEGVLQGFTSKARTWLRQNRENIAEWARSAVGAIASFVKFVADSIPSIKAAAVALGALWAVGKAVAFYEAMKRMSELSVSLGLVTAATNATTASLTGMGLVLSSLVGGISAVAAVLAGAFYLSMVKAQKESAKFIAKLDESYDRMKRNFRAQTGVDYDEYGVMRDALRSGQSVERLNMLGSTNRREITDIGVLGAQFQAGLVQAEEIKKTADLNRENAKALMDLAKAKREDLGLTSDSTEAVSEFGKSLRDSVKAAQEYYDQQNRSSSAASVGAKSDSVFLSETLNAASRAKEAEARLNAAKRDLEMFQSAQEAADEAASRLRGAQNLEAFLNPKSRQAGVGPDIASSERGGRKKKEKDPYLALLEAIKRMRLESASEYDKILVELDQFVTEYGALLERLAKDNPLENVQAADYFADKISDVSKKLAEAAESARKAALAESGFTEALKSRSIFDEKNLENANKYHLEAKRLTEELAKLKNIPALQVLDERGKRDLEAMQATIASIMSMMEQSGSMTGMQAEAYNRLKEVFAQNAARLAGGPVALTAAEQAARDAKIAEDERNRRRADIRGDFEEFVRYVPSGLRAEFDRAADAFAIRLAEAGNTFGEKFKAVGLAFSDVVTGSLVDAAIRIIGDIYEQSQALYQEFVGANLLNADSAASVNFGEERSYRTVGGRRASEMSGAEIANARRGGALVKTETERVGKTVTPVGKAIVDELKGKWNNFYARAASNLRSIGPRLAAWLRTWANQIKNQLPGYLRSLVKELPRIMRAAVPAIAEFASSLAAIAVTELPAMIVYVFDMIVVTAARMIPAVIRALPDAIVLFIQALIDQIPLLISELVRLVPNIVSALIEAIARTGPAIAKMVFDKDTWKTAFGNAGRVSARSFIKSFGEGMKNAFEAYFDWWKNAFKKVTLDGLKDALRALIDWVKDKLGIGDDSPVGNVLDGLTGGDENKEKRKREQEKLKNYGKAAKRAWLAAGGTDAGWAKESAKSKTYTGPDGERVKGPIRWWRHYGDFDDFPPGVYHSGGLVRGGSSFDNLLRMMLGMKIGPDETVAKLQPGEFVIPKDITSDIFSGRFASQIARGMARSSRYGTGSESAMASAMGAARTVVHNTNVTLAPKTMFTKDVATVLDETQYQIRRSSGFKSNKNLNLGYAGA